MIVVKIELHNANTGEVSEIGRMTIVNVGGSSQLGDYAIDVMPDTWCGDPKRTGRIERYHRLTSPVWELVARALGACGFDGRAPSAGAQSRPRSK